MTLKVSQLVRAAYRLFFKRDNRCFFLRLDPDILVQSIFPLLLVEELISLRRVNRALYILTHEPIIWKGYLNTITFPVCPIRPTFNPIDPAATYELETLVTSACALYRSWVGSPKIASESILVARNKIVDLKLLPGGKFLVASVKDRSNHRFFIHVYAMDVMYGSRLLARLPTHFKVYDIQAKYMDHMGRPGIMISYTRRRFKHGVPVNLRRDINELHHRAHFDQYHPLIYEACCVHMPLDAVEALIRPELVPLKNDAYLNTIRCMEKPFVEVLTYQTDAEIHSPTLFEDEERPCIAFAEDRMGESKVQVIALDNRFGTTLRFRDRRHFEGVPHRVRAIRYLPCQRGLFVIRSLSPQPQGNENLAFEIFTCPNPRNPEMDEPQYILMEPLPVNSWDWRGVWKIQGEMVISDPVPPTNVAPNYPGLHVDDTPPTLWVFAPSSNPRGCAYWWFRAQPTDQTRRQWRYTQTEHKPFIHLNRKYSERALPGSERTLYLELDNEGFSEASILSRIRRFYWPSDRFPEQFNFTVPTTQAAVPVTSRPEKEEIEYHAMSAKDTTILDIKETRHMRTAVNSSGGLIAITWDEYSGKICLAAEQEDKIRVYDMAPIAEPHRTLAYKWRTQLIGLEPDTMDKKLAMTGLFDLESPFY